MARTSRTPYVILGLLSVEPMSGYELKATIDRSISHFWSESFGQLYPALHRLTDQGLVRKEEAPTGGRSRHVYHITPEGHEHLRAWLSEPPGPRMVRNETLLKLFFGRDMEPEVLKEVLRAQQAMARAEAAGMEAAMEGLRREEAEAPELQYWLLTLDLGLRSARAKEEWATAALEGLG